MHKTKELIYRLSHWIVWILSRLFFRVKCFGYENIPSKGGVLVVANHQSFLDPLVIGACIKRDAYYIGRADLFEKNSLFAWILHTVHCIPIKRDGFTRQTFKIIKNLLEKGEVVLIFPEGTRSSDGKLQRGLPGVGLIIDDVIKKGVKIIPARIFNSEQALGKGAKMVKFVPLEVKFGPPIAFGSINLQEEDHKERYQRLTDIVMEHIGKIS